MRWSLLPLLALATGVALTGGAPLGTRSTGSSRDLDVVVQRDPAGLIYTPPITELHVRSIEREERVSFPPVARLDKRDDDDDDDDDELSDGAIAAVSVASVLGLLLLLFIFYWFVIRPRRKAELRAANTPKDEESAANFTTVDLRGGRPDGIGSSSAGSNGDRALSSIVPGSVGVAGSMASSSALNPPSLSYSPSSPTITTTATTPATTANIGPSYALPGGIGGGAPAPSYQPFPPAVAAIVATRDEKSAPPGYPGAAMGPAVSNVPPESPESRLPPTAPPPEDITPLYDYHNHNHNHDPQQYQDHPYQQDQHEHRQQHQQQCNRDDSTSHGIHNHYQMGQTPSSPPEYEQAVSPLTPPGSPPPPGPFRHLG